MALTEIQRDYTGPSKVVKETFTRKKHYNPESPSKLAVKGYAQTADIIAYKKAVAMFLEGKSVNDISRELRIITTGVIEMKKVFEKYLKQCHETDH